MIREHIESEWQQFHYHTASVLPVRMACNARCLFCFSKSSLSTLEQDSFSLTPAVIRAYCHEAKNHGATRFVITGGGEPLLRFESVLAMVEIARQYFDEIALFSNGILLNNAKAQALKASGLSYLCLSRHAISDEQNRQLMGTQVRTLESMFNDISVLKVRATCVMAKGYVEDIDHALAYMRQMIMYGVSEFTFKHTYVAYENSVFRDSQEDHWARQHQVERDPFADFGVITQTLPWGPSIRRMMIESKEVHACYYREPTPSWEKHHRIGRSLNLMSDGTVYGSLEDKSSLLYRFRA